MVVLVIEFDSDGDEKIPDGISLNHNDGMCFKLIIKYMLDPGDGLESIWTYYSEDNILLLEYAMHLANKQYCFDIQVLDDSK